MGITRSSKQKHRLTGGRMPIHRKKRKFEMGRQPSMTKLGEQKVVRVRGRGSGYKYRALKLNEGNFMWVSTSTQAPLRLENHWPMVSVSILRIRAWNLPPPARKPCTSTTLPLAVLPTSGDSVGRASIGVAAKRQNQVTMDSVCMWTTRLVGMYLPSTCGAMLTT